MCPPDWKYTDVLADYTGQGQDASGGDLRCYFLWSREIRVTSVNGTADAADGSCGWKLSLCVSFCSQTACVPGSPWEGKGSEVKS